MADEPRNVALLPQEKRRLATEHRLRTALERLVGDKPSHPSLRGRTYRLTVAVLAREARVSRNTIYANHRAILDELNPGDRQTVTSKQPARVQKMAELGALIEELRQRNRQLATENASLLKRAIDAEKAADRLKKHNAKVIRELAAARQPVTLIRPRV